jgi:hypothetical protein
MAQLDDLRDEYNEAVACEMVARRLRQNATEALLAYLGIRPRFTTLRTFERSQSWLASYGNCG